MTRSLLISVRPYLCRVALVEGGALREVRLQRAGERSPVNNIYSGRVKRFLPGINAAFIDIGEPRDGFIYAGDAIPGRRAGAEPPPIDRNLRLGQRVLVQVLKEPLKNKGARLTTDISLAGRFLVYLPKGAGATAVSKRIGDDAERARLRGILSSMIESSDGVIARTAAEGRSEDEISADLTYLRKLWRQISQRAEAAGGTELVFEDLDLALRAVRDLLNPSVDEVIVDHLVTSERVRAFVEGFLPGHAGRIRYVSPQPPLFERYDVESAIARAVDPRVWLASGGYLVIEETEALTSIDVNTGRFGGSADVEASITRINLEAATAIAHQLRLRDIGGIVVIDFIDMKRAEDSKAVVDALRAGLRADRARSRVLPMSAFGLVEMTRERSGDSLGRRLTDACGRCAGRGVHRSAWLSSVRILGQLEVLFDDGDVVGAQVVGHPDVLDTLADEFDEALAALRAGGASGDARKIVLHAREDYAFETYQVIGQRRHDRD